MQEPQLSDRCATTDLGGAERVPDPRPWTTVLRTRLSPLPLQIEAGQYCTFVISSDGSVRACGKGSYGRLGLGDSNNQSTLKKLTFEPHRAIKKVSSSKGSDGHTLAFTTEGEVFSWGDGDYGKLGHGNSSTQKYPKLIQGPLQGKVWFHLTHSSYAPSPHSVELA